MRRELLLLTHILDALHDIVEFTADGEAAFMTDRKTQHAVIRSFEIIGEASKQLPREVTERHPAVPWRTLAGFRDVLIHAYYRVDLDEVWASVEGDVPKLLSQIEAVCKKEDDQD